jgi:hypothetical protein
VAWDECVLRVDLGQGVQRGNPCCGRAVDASWEARVTRFAMDAPVVARV